MKQCYCPVQDQGAKQPRINIVGQVKGQYVLAASGEHVETLPCVQIAIFDHASCLPMVLELTVLSCTCMQSTRHLLQQPAAATAVLCLDAEPLQLSLVCCCCRLRQRLRPSINQAVHAAKLLCGSLNDQSRAAAAMQTW